MGIHLGGNNRNINCFKRLDLYQQNVGVFKSPNPYIYLNKACIHFKHVIILEKKGNTQLLKIIQVLKYFHKQGYHHTTNIQYKTVFGKTNHSPLPLNQLCFKGWCSSMKSLRCGRWGERVKDGFSLCYLHAKFAKITRIVLTCWTILHFGITELIYNFSLKLFLPK